MFPLQSGMPPASAPCAPAQPRRRHCLTLGLVGWLADGLSGSAAQAANVPVIRYPAPQSPLDTRSLDLISLLEAALRRTEATHGPVRLQPTYEVLTELRQFAELDADRGILHVTWATVSAERRTLAKAIPFDARHGLLGLRIALVDERRLPDIAKIRDLAALQRLTIGQGLAWPDVDVLRASGIKVQTVSGYENLFRMLMAGRFDLFPRGVGEVFDEYEARHAQMPRLAIDPHLLLVYPYPYQYYFAPSQSALAARVEKGLLAMKADGSFDAHLWRFHGTAVARARLQDRLALRLTNPNVGPEAERALEATLAFWRKPPPTQKR